MKVESVLRPNHPLQHEQNSKHMTSAKENSSVNNADTIRQSEKEMDTEQVETIVSKLNEFMEPVRTNLEFEFHEKLEDYYVKVINRETDEVIREIPPEKMLDMYAEMAEFMGLLVDEKI